MKLWHELCDPIDRTKNMSDTEFLKYIKICDEEAGKKASPDMIRGIENVFYHTHSNVPRESLDKVWNTIAPSLKDSPALTDFTADYRGAESKYFFPWLVNADMSSGSPSLALEMAYGDGEDLNGNWVRGVEEEDPIMEFVKNDPTFVYNRERQLKVADLASSVIDYYYDTQHTGKIVDLGAGRLAWARHHGFIPKPDSVEIHAFDRDTSIDIKQFFHDPVKDYGIHYHHGDLFAQKGTPECQGAALVILGGVASYMTMPIFAEKVLKPVHGLLLNEGDFFFDLQLDCPYYQRSMKLWHWPPMFLPETVSDAVDSVEAALEDLYHDGMVFGAEYIVSKYGTTPISIMVTLTKID